ncbi:MAG: hypothetical protein F6K19_27640, partial [Cyanothece sp. SIO1E1]|nr:hypothetical protein [Cyanothece sp. SIO1E1]
MRVDVNYLNIGVTLLNFEVDVEFTDHQVSIDYSKTNSSTGSGYSAFQPSSNGQIVRIAGRNFSFGSTLICSIYFNLPAGADTDIEFFSIFQFLSYEIPNINDPNNPIVVQEVCGNETSHNSEYYDKPIYSISGNVLNLPYGVDLENVEVEATSSTIDKIDVTNSSGQFSLTGLEAMENYDIACQKINDDPLCGINSLDVTVIQRHIRGVEPFLSTWQYLAADVSGDELVTTLDILKIQALLLNGAGLTKKWTFIPASTYGGLGFSPWPFDEYMQFNNLSQSHSNEDFYAVKGG